MVKRYLVRQIVRWTREHFWGLVLGVVLGGIWMYCYLGLFTAS